MAAVAAYVKKNDPEIVVFQEAKGELPGEKGGGKDSVDGLLLRKKYPHRMYVHEMTGKDGASYGYWMAAKQKPDQWIEDGFSFPGGVSRKVQAAVWKNISESPKGCLGVLSLHFSYQNSQVRQQEAAWVLDWVKRHESLCGSWLVVGDFNADKEDKEMQILFEGGLHSLFQTLKPTIGAFNPIRRIYGENIPSRTIDWALGNQVNATAKVVLDAPYKEKWVSDHAAVEVRLTREKKRH